MGLGDSTDGGRPVPSWVESVMSAVVPVARITVVPSIRGLFSQPTTAHLTTVACLVLSLGVLLSIATTTDPLWWHLHFSRLGTLDDFSAAVFNNTLIAAGIVIILVANSARREFQRLGRSAARRGTGIVAQVFLTAGGTNLGLVGCVPLDVNQSLHDNIAALMVLSFACLVLVAPFVMHRMPRRLLVASILTFALLFASAYLFVTGAINLALFELVGFGAIFTWNSILAKCLRMRALSLAREVRVAADVTDATPVARDAACTASPAGPATDIRDEVSARLGAAISASPHRAARMRRRSPLPAPRRVHRHPAPPAAQPAARGPLPRGCRASGARGASARSMTRARR